MLSSISWTQFLTALFISAGLYYLAILLLFYRKDLLALMTRPSHTDLGIEDPLPAPAPTEQPQPVVQGGPIPTPQEKPSFTEQIFTRLRTVIQKTAADGVAREDVLASIKFVLGNYPEIKDTALGSAVNSFIIQECLAISQIQVSDKELKNLWSG